MIHDNKLSRYIQYNKYNTTAVTATGIAVWNIQSTTTAITRT